MRPHHKIEIVLGFLEIVVADETAVKYPKFHNLSLNLEIN
jgi:hypothetical protein